MGVNYKEVVKGLDRNFWEKKGVAFVYKVEKGRSELCMLKGEVMEVRKEWKEVWLGK